MAKGGGTSIESRFSVAKSGTSIPWQGGLKCKKEKKAMMKALKKWRKTLKQSTLFLEDLVEEHENWTTNANSDCSSQVSDSDETFCQVWEDSVQENKNWMMKTNPNFSSRVSESDEACCQVSEDSSPRMDDVCSTLAQWVNDSDDNVPRVDLTEESSRFIDKAASVIQGYNANEGKKYQFQQILTVIATHEIPVSYYFLTFQVRDGEAAADDHVAWKTCWAKIADYGLGESYVDSCSVF